MRPFIFCVFALVLTTALVSRGASIVGLPVARENFRKDYFNPKTHVALAASLYRAGRLTDAFWVMEGARLTFLEHEFGEALKAESIRIPLPPNSKLDAELELARKEGNQAKARTAFKKFVEENPERTVEFLDYSFGLMFEGSVNEVRQLAEKTLARNPKHAGAATIKGALMIQDRKFDEAIVWLKKAYSLEPGIEYVTEKLAALYWNEKKSPRDALPYYIRAHQINPSFRDTGFAEQKIKKLLAEEQPKIEAELNSADKIINALKSEDATVRLAACEAAKRLHSPKLIEPLAEKFDDDVGLVVNCADNALFQMAKNDSTSPVRKYRERWVNSPTIQVRSVSLNLFGELLPPKDAVPFLISKLTDSQSLVRWRAAQGLQKHKPHSSAAVNALARFEAEERDKSMLEFYKRYLDHLNQEK